MTMAAGGAFKDSRASRFMKEANNVTGRSLSESQLDLQMDA